MTKQHPLDLLGRESSIIRTLRSHCIKGLTIEHDKVIAARLVAPNLAQAGRVIGYSPSQMRRRWDQIKELVLIPLALPPHDDALVGLWIALHMDHCTARVNALLLDENVWIHRPRVDATRSSASSIAIQRKYQAPQDRPDDPDQVNIRLCSHTDLLQPLRGTNRPPGALNRLACREGLDSLPSANQTEPELHCQKMTVDLRLLLTSKEKDLAA